MSPRGTGDTHHEPWLDAVRVLACLLVIVIHSPLIRNGQGSFWLSAFNYLASPCIGLFFMISGATLLPIRVSTRLFLRSRFGRIVPPLVTWSILYLGVAVLYAETSPGNALAAALRIPLAAVGNDAFWFLYSLLGLYLFLPFLSPWIAGATPAMLRLYLGAWVLALGVPYADALLPGVSQALATPDGLLANFQGYAGYAVAGFYLRKYPPDHATSLLTPRRAIPFTLVSVVIPVLFYLGVFRGLENRVLYGYLTANVALLAVGLFCIMQRGAPHLVQWKTPLQQVGGDTFGIYLVHLMILRRVVQPIIIAHGPEFPLLQIPATAAATFLLSLCLVELIRMLPGFLPYLLLGTDESSHPAGTFGGG